MNDIIATVRLDDIKAYLAIEDIKQSQILTTLHDKLARAYNTETDDMPDCIALHDAKAGEIVATVTSGTLSNIHHGTMTAAVYLTGDDDETR